VVARKALTDGVEKVAGEEAVDELPPWAVDTT
jgi:hypothetical protein